MAFSLSKKCGCSVEYLSYLSDLGRSGITRARKLASLREYFKYLVDQDLMPSSPAASVAIPKKERKQQTYLRPDEKAVMAAKNYLTVRPESIDTHLFLNYNGEGLSRRGAEKIIEKYRVLSGINKGFSCHFLRHTFGSYEAEQGVSPFQLKEWMGHSSI